MYKRYGRRLPLNQKQGQILALMSWLIPTITILCAMLVHFIGGARTFPIFISEADHPGPERIIFTAGVIVTGLTQMLFAWHLYHTIEPEKEGMWTVSSVLGMVVGFHVILVAHYDMYDHIDTHIYAAMVAFGGGLVWATLGHLSLNSSSSPGAKLRKTGIAISFASLVIMIVSFQYAVSTFDTTGLTTEEFLNNAQIGINIAGPAEYFVVCGLMMALGSFGMDLAGNKEESPTDSEVVTDQFEE